MQSFSRNPLYSVNSHLTTLKLGNHVDLSCISSFRNPKHLRGNDAQVLAEQFRTSGTVRPRQKQTPVMLALQSHDEENELFS